MPEFCPHFARRWIHLHSGKRRFLLIFGCAQNRKLYERYSQIVTSITFFSRSRKKLKKHDTGIQMTTKWIIFLRPNFILIFQKIHQTSPVTRFFQRKKRFKKWWKLRVLSCFEDDSHTEIRLPDGSSKSCKITPKCNTNHREMSMKKHEFRSRNAQKRTPSTDLQNYIETRSLLSLPVLLCARHACKNCSKSLKTYQ